MSDTWESTTLGDAFPGVKSTSENIKAESDKLFTNFNKLKDKVSGKVSDLQSITNGATSLLDDLAASGFYKLVLPAGSGSIKNRIASAGGTEPPTSGYSAGIFIGFSAADLSSVQAMKTKLDNILNSSQNVPK